MTYEKFLDCLEQELHDLMKNGEEDPPCGGSQK